MAGRKLRVGVVGCGNVARAHVLSYQSISRVEIVSVFDVSKATARKRIRESELTDARIAESLKEMVDEDKLDAVSVCTPPAFHHQCAKPFLAAGVPVYCEKPLEIDLPAARKFAATVKKCGTLFMMGYNHRFYGPIIEMKKVIDSGILGKPLLFRNIFGGYMKLKGGHRADAGVSGGGCLIDHCSHSVDLFRYLVGEPTEVHAWGGNVMQNAAIEDFGMINFSIDGKAFGEITATYSIPAAPNWVEWHGTKGSALANYWNAGHPDLELKFPGGASREIDCSKHDENRYLNALRHFTDCVRKKEAPLVTAEDGLRASAIVDAVYKSNREGKRVRISKRRGA